MQAEKWEFSFFYVVSIVCLGIRQVIIIIGNHIRNFGSSFLKVLAKQEGSVYFAKIVLSRWKMFSNA